MDLHRRRGLIAGIWQMLVLLVLMVALLELEQLFSLEQLEILLLLQRHVRHRSRTVPVAPSAARKRIRWAGRRRERG
jgi:hypothetical protein